jgi:hypothetical protein
MAQGETMVAVTHEVAQKVRCCICGCEKFALDTVFICHDCWKSGKAAHTIQQLTETLNEWSEQYKKIINDGGCPDEVHCSCVPALRAEIMRLTPRAPDARKRG